jgi:hypothetical protein
MSPLLMGVFFLEAMGEEQKIQPLSVLPSGRPFDKLRDQQALSFCLNAKGPKNQGCIAFP